MRLSARLVGAVVAAAALVAFAQPAEASLGGDASTVDLDRTQTRSALVGITRVNTHVMHEMLTPSGVIVREYVSPTGVVFAVTWQGAWAPDLQQILGTYYDRYVLRSQDIQRQRRTRGPATVRDGELVVQVSGHQRAFSGTAYLSNRLPAGLTAQSIR